MGPVAGEGGTGDGGEEEESTSMEVARRAVETSEAEGAIGRVIILRGPCLQNLNPIDTWSQII